MNVPAPTRESPLVLTRHAWVMFAPVAPARTPVTRISVDDWDALFRAVTTRLKEAAGVQPQHSPAADLQPVVLECVDALQLLHAALAQERAQRNPQQGAQTGTV